MKRPASLFLSALLVVNTAYSGTSYFAKLNSLFSSIISGVSKEASVFSSLVKERDTEAPDQKLQSVNSCEIKLITPKEGQSIPNPVLVSGWTHGIWVKEGWFNGRIESGGEVLGSGKISIGYIDPRSDSLQKLDMPPGSWQPFKGYLYFKQLENKADAVLILEKTYPSNLPPKSKRPQFFCEKRIKVVLSPLPQKYDIKVTNPTPNQVIINSPLKISGFASDTWFWRDEIPVSLYEVKEKGQKGVLLGSSVVKRQLPSCDPRLDRAKPCPTAEKIKPVENAFAGELKFSDPNTTRGVLIFTEGAPKLNLLTPKTYEVQVRFLPNIEESEKSSTGVSDSGKITPQLTPSVKGVITPSPATE